ncbi:MAG: energy coupling factor transporter S component ThiW [Chloroflexi bacterium]|nr:energy coupling factor transporter S component ThiW [Chloroflexota bacterium]
METRKVAYAVVLVALGVVLAPFTSIPIGIARVNPTQHFVNVLAAVLLGPWYAVTVALVISIIRNALGVGTLLAFPGSMIGAFLAGYTYRIMRNVYGAAVAEIIGTGIVGSFVSVYLVAPVFIGRATELSVLMSSFLGSTIVGSVIAVAALKVLARAGYTTLVKREA